jgi:hypothetical protein
MEHDLFQTHYFNLLFINYQNIPKVINLSERVTQIHEQSVQ